MKTLERIWHFLSRRRPATPPSPSPAAPAPVAEAGAAAEPSPVQEVMRLLSGRDAEAVERVVHALELQRVLAWEAEGLHESNLDRMLAALRPRLRHRQTEQLPTVAELAFATAEPLFTEGLDERPWSIPLSWRRAIWVLARRRDPARIAALSSQYAQLVEATEGRPLPATLALASGAAQAVLRDLLEEIVGDPAFIEMQASEIQESFGGGPAKDRTSRFTECLRGLWLAMVAQHRAGAVLSQARQLLRAAALKPNWRQAWEIDTAVVEIGQAMPLLAGKGASTDQAHSPAAAFFVLLGRTLTDPGPLLEVIRRRTLVDLNEPQPFDTRTSGDMAAVIEDLVGYVEILETRIEERLVDAAGQGGVYGALTSAGDVAVRAAATIRGIDGSAILDPGGRRLRRLDGARRRLAGMVAGSLMPRLRELVVEPISEGGGNEAGGHALDAAVKAASLLGALVAVADGLRCRPAAEAVAAAVLEAIRLDVERMAVSTRAGASVPAERQAALLAIAEALAPGAGAELRKSLPVLERA